MFFARKKIISAVVFAAMFSLTGLNAKPAQAQEVCIGSLMLFGANYCPRGYANADGQLLAISEFSALYSLYGTMYGGDGRTSFALPDLRGRSLVHAGTGPGLSPIAQGQTRGAETAQISIANMPAHNHPLQATSSLASTSSPGRDLLARGQFYAPGPFNKTMAADGIGSTGGGVPIATRSPVIALRYCVAIQGIYCSRN